MQRMKVRTVAEGVEHHKANPVREYADRGIQAGRIAIARGNIREALAEHLEDPTTLVRKWLPKCKAAVISHPLDEPLDSMLAAGDHCWSFSEADLLGWFAIGGYNEIRECATFSMGQYKIGIARGLRA